MRVLFDIFVQKIAIVFQINVFLWIHFISGMEFVTSHWFGAPISTCNNMLPDLTKFSGHGATLNVSDESPWFIKIYKRDVGIVSEYEPGVGTQSLVVEIVGPKFRGFQLQARSLAGYSRRVGTFVTPIAQGTQFLACDGLKSTAVTHSDHKFKQNIWFTWKPPINSQGPIQFIATIVREKSEIWPNIRSDYIYPKIDSNKMHTRFCGRGMGCIHFGAPGCQLENSCAYFVSWKCARDQLVIEMIGNESNQSDVTNHKRERRRESHGIGIVPHRNQLSNGSVSCVMGRDFYWHSKKRRAPQDKSQVQLVPLGTSQYLPISMQNHNRQFFCRFVILNVKYRDAFNFYVSQGNDVLSIIRDESPVRVCSHPHLHVNLPVSLGISNNFVPNFQFLVLMVINCIYIKILHG